MKFLYFSSLRAALVAGVNLIQLRSKNLTLVDYLGLANKVLALTRQFSATLLLNQSAQLLDQIDADGIHYTSQRLAALTHRPVASDKLFSVACHDRQQIQQAEQYQADCMTLSPVFITPSSPSRPALGWQRFATLANTTAIPIYALGGLSPIDLAQAQQCGAYGIAAKRSLWATNRTSLELVYNR